MVPVMLLEVAVVPLIQEGYQTDLPSLEFAPATVWQRLAMIWYQQVLRVVL